MNWLILLFIYQIKHFVADFPLQTKFMLGKFKADGWIIPLSAHCAVHAVFTILISSCFVSLIAALALGLFDFIVHFIMDRIKASPQMLGRFQSLSKEQFKGLSESRALAMNGVSYEANPELMKESKRIVCEIDAKFKGNTYFWWALGFDQIVHHFTHYAIIYMLVR